MAIAQEPIRGSWWSHPKSHEIFHITQAVRDSTDVLVCRLVDSKITFVHRRLWPALVRAAAELPAGGLAQVKEIHAESGRHVVRVTPFPKWVPREVRSAARRLTKERALLEIVRRIELPTRGSHP